MSKRLRRCTWPFLGVATLALVAIAWLPVRAQESCPGDIDGDTQITGLDVDHFVPGLFDDPAPLAVADANGDDAVSVADLVAIARSLGTICNGGPTPTSTPTGVTPTSTSGSPTPTTQITPLPHPTCIVQPALLGNTNGDLTTSDCERNVAGKLRFADVYSIAVNAGQAIRVEVRAIGGTSAFVPFVFVIDADGQFGRVDGAPPVQFVATTSRPYTVFVTSAPTSTQELGPYLLTLSATPCAAPVVLSAGGARNGNLDGSECPDPARPVVGGGRNPVDVYTFTVADVPTNISLTMRQSSVNDDIAPALTVLGPEGFEIIGDEQNFDCTASDSQRLCTQTRFLALQAGQYQVIASGGAGTGRYTLALSKPSCTVTALNSIPTDRPFVCPGQSGSGCTGVLQGDTKKTSCAAPLAYTSLTEGPDPSSPADLYTFTANDGDVISIEMESDDSPHLFLLGPASAGNPLVAADDGDGGATAQLAATLARAGTYTIIAANDTALEPPNADDPIGDQVFYRMFVQRCPAVSGLGFGPGGAVSSTFTALDCFGFGGIPFRSYRINGTAGNFVSASLRSTDFVPFLHLLGPDGSEVANGDDLFAPGTGARVNRTFPQDGAYFVEVSSAIARGAVDVSGATAPAFTLEALECTPTGISPGTITGAFGNPSCALPDGRRLDVRMAAAAGPARVASLFPPLNACAVGLLANGPQVPEVGCSKDLVEIPVVGNGQYGFIFAADDAAIRGSYSAQLATCPLATLRYGAVQTGALTATSCADATSAPAGWFLFRASAGLVSFNDGVGGEAIADFPFGGTVVDVATRVAWTGSFAEPAGTMFPIDADLAVVLKVAGVSIEDAGNYSVEVGPAQFRSR